MNKNICGSAIAALALSLACGGKSNTTTPGNVTITGTLQSGSVTHMIDTSTEALELSTRADALAGPLGGYKLYCVTFGSPPVAASGTADSSGNVSVTFAAQGVAFGCFVQDAAGSTVATLSFQAASTAGTALTVSSSTSLGNITVDLNSGLASASVSTGTVATTPPGSSCPMGTWVFQTGTSEPACASTAPQTTARVWVAPTSNGGCCTVSLTHGPESHGQGVCSYGSWGGLPGVYSNGVLTFGPFNGNSGGGVCQQPITFQMSPNGSCTSATAAVHFEGCASCGSGANVCTGSGTPPCGTTSCNATYSGTRQ